MKGNTSVADRTGRDGGLASMGLPVFLIAGFALAVAVAVLAVVLAGNRDRSSLSAAAGSHGPSASNVYYLQEPDGSVLSYELDEGGDPGAVNRAPGEAKGVDMAVAPRGDAVYSITSDASRGKGVVRQHAIDSDTGSLAEMGAWTVGTSPSAIALSPDGKFAHVADKSSNRIFKFSIRKRGSERIGKLAYDDGATVETTGSPADVAISPDGRHGYVATNGGSNGVAVHSVDSGTGALSSEPLQTVPVQSRPSSVALTPDGEGLYVSASGSARGVVHQFRRDSLTGRVNAIGRSDVPGVSSLRGGVVSGDGNNFYVAGLGEKPSDGAIGQFAIDSKSKRLTVLDDATTRAGASPVAIALSADGARAYVANREGLIHSDEHEANDSDVMIRDPESGGLTGVATPSDQESRRSAVVVLPTAGAPASSHIAPAGPSLAPIRHVFTIVLENEKVESTFGAASKADPKRDYLAKVLPEAGAITENYFGTSHFSNSNYVTMMSGQPANWVNQIDCEIYTDFKMKAMDAEGIAVGKGCVFPMEVKTVTNQLESAGFTWKGYMEDMQLAYPKRPKNCQYPKPNGVDTTFLSRRHDQYAARHNPFVYFKSIRDTPSCVKNNVPYTEFHEDIKSIATTPNFSFIIPDQCNSSHDEFCFVDPRGLQGLDRFNAWLKAEVPKILDSPAFKQDGLLIITFDESSVILDSRACCDQPRGPNTLNPGLLRPGPGGGKVGAVFLSPFIKPGTVSTESYNHYSYLHTIEDIFGLPYLGYAKRPNVKSFGADIFTNLP